MNPLYQTNIDKINELLGRIDKIKIVKYFTAQKENSILVSEMNVNWVRVRDEWRHRPNHIISVIIQGIMYPKSITSHSTIKRDWKKKSQTMFEGREDVWDLLNELFDIFTFSPVWMNIDKYAYDKKYKAYLASLEELQEKRRGSDASETIKKIWKTALKCFIRPAPAFVQYKVKTNTNPNRK